MSEPQLERSVLEAKEREELYAIAEALGTKPGSRAKKADLIVQILRATGVEVGEDAPAEKPRRTRAKKATGVVAKTVADVGPAHDAGPTEASNGGAIDGADVRAAGDLAPGQAGGDAASGNGATVTSGPRRGDSDGWPGGGRLGGERTGSDRAGHDDAGGDRVGGDRGGGDRGGGDRVGGDRVGSDRAGGDRAGGDRVGGDRVGGDRAGGERAASDRAGADLAGADGAGGEGGPADRAGGDRLSVDRESADRGGGDRAGGYDSFINDGLDATSAQIDRAGDEASGQQSYPTPSSGGQSSSGGSHTGAAARFDSEPGNRRNRRRRGRERSSPERLERELPGQGAEPAYSGDPIPVKGFLDLRDEGYGFLRTKGYIPGPNDVYVSISQARRFALRKGDALEGACRPPGSSEKYPALLRIDTISGLTPEEARVRPKFEDLTPLFPDEKMRLEVPGDPANLTARIVDLISPIGKGQRGLIVSPPKAGKTTVLKQIAHSIEANNPEVFLMVLLVDERPEEVTDMRRSVKGEVVASTFDRPAEEHTQVAELTIERAKRLVELGKDVVIVLDGITRLARAYNLAQPATGRIMSGGIDTGALYPPKKFFGSARNIEEGGSLTILATALVETGSRMDEVIFEEFKGTGNMELRLDRKLAERRIYPALDVNASSTRHEELLFDRQQLQQVWKLRRVLNALGTDGSDAAGLQLLMDKIKSTKSNDEFLAEIAKTPAPAI